MKTLIVLTSPPACGKSTWAKNYQKTHKDCYIVSSDEIRFELTGKTDDFTRQDEVWKVFDERITEKCNEGGKDAIVIADSLMDLNRLRREIVEKHPEFDRFVLIYFLCLYEESCINNKNRPSQYIVPDDVLKALWDKFEKPDIKTLDMYDNFIRIIGNFKN